jgi:hypothetical protein
MHVSRHGTIMPVIFAAVSSDQALLLAGELARNAQRDVLDCPLLPTALPLREPFPKPR